MARPALLVSIVLVRVAMSVPLVEIMVGAIAGNSIGLQLTPSVAVLAGFGAILLSFLAGIDSRVIRSGMRDRRKLCNEGGSGHWSW